MPQKAAAPARAQVTTQLLGKKIHLTNDADGVVLAEGEGKPAAPVQAYVIKAFGKHLAAVKKAMDDLAAVRAGGAQPDRLPAQGATDVRGLGRQGCARSGEDPRRN